jgi:hypothetical protein
VLCAATARAAGPGALASLALDALQPATTAMIVAACNAPPCQLLARRRVPFMPMPPPSRTVRNLRWTARSAKNNARELANSLTSLRLMPRLVLTVPVKQ